MTTRKSLQCQLILGSIILFGCLTLLHTPAYPQGYIAGQLGVSIPGSLSNVDVTSQLIGNPPMPTPPGTQFSDFDLHNSFLIGAKAGYFSRSIRWFGVEAEVFHTTPHVKQQPVTTTLGSGFIWSDTGTPTSNPIISPGLSFRMITLAPLNLVFRYPGHRLQPYVAVGPGIFLARLKQLGDSQSSTKLGLNSQVGLRYFMSRHWALFGEYKFNYVRLDFKETNVGRPIGLDGFDATYIAHNFVFGVGYHF